MIKDTSEMVTRIDVQELLEPPSRQHWEQLNELGETYATIGQ